MRRGFVLGVLLFSVVAATAAAVYVRVALGHSWLGALSMWLILFAALGALVNWGLPLRRERPRPDRGATGRPGSPIPA